MSDVIQFIDGFDHYQPSTEWFYKWSLSGGSIAQFAPGRFSAGQAWRFFNNAFVMKQLPIKSAAWRIGFGFYVNTSASNSFVIIQLGEDATVHGGIQVNGPTRTIQFHRNGTTVGSASSYTIPIQTWIHIEMYLVTTDTLSSGNAIVKVNGNTELTLSSGDTRNGGTAGTPNCLYLEGLNGWEVYYDDLIVTSMDTTTTPTFLGDRRVYTLYPSGDGNYSQFVGSDGNSVNNSLLVDESLAVAETDYVESATPGNRDSYAIDNPALTPSDIKCVAVNLCLGKADAGDRSYKPFVRLSSTNYDQTVQYPPSSPTINQTILETSPATGIAWTSTELNALEAGVKVEA